MIFTDATWKYFSLIPFKVRAAMAASKAYVPFDYEDEPFFTSYDALHKTWVKRQSQRMVAEYLNISRDTLKKWEEHFVDYGTIGLLPELSYVDVDLRLEKLTVLIKSSRPHESANLALKLADALEIPGVSLELIRQIQRCYGYGHRLDGNDIQYFSGLQHILSSIAHHKRKRSVAHDKTNRAKSFYNFDHDPLQQRVELFKTLSEITKKRQIRLVLRRFGIHPNRYYLLKDRYMMYGIWGLVDLFQISKVGEKISPELELQIIEERLMDPSLSTARMIKKLCLRCSKANVQKVYTKWELSRFKKPVVIRGVVSQQVPEKIEKKISEVESSAKLRFPDLIKTANLKVNRSFTDLIKCLSYRKVFISNPGAIIAASFLDQLGVVEALHTYEPPVYRSQEITNNIIVNVLRIIVGFPTINDFTLNCRPFSGNCFRVILKSQEKPVL